MVTAVCLAPTTSAHAAAVPTGECPTLGQVDTARVDLGSAIVEHRAAQTHRRAARSKYDAAPTPKRMQVLLAARAVVRTTLAARLTARDVYDVAKASYTACPPSVAVTNPRVAYYGNFFGIADITWSHVPDGEYHYFMRYDGAPVYQGSVTFIDVIPPPPPFDPGTPRRHIRYFRTMSPM